MIRNSKRLLKEQMMKPPGSGPGLAKWKSRVCCSQDITTYSFIYNHLRSYKDPISLKEKSPKEYYIRKGS